ncbi:MAG: CHAT domain-containing protein [Calothrix sp. FI2-JRJ7]|jgi:hypothetical protein|nr:CHAT domain-containing protein [Calothrix sp. FI2-JRJ7]
MNAVPIVNKSVAPAGQTPAGSSLFGLRVKDGQSLRLVGGDVDSSDGDLIALGGQVEISGKNIVAVKNIGTIGYFGSPAGTITLKATGNITVSGELDSFAFARLGNAGNGAPISLNTSNGTINITGDLNSWPFTQSGNTGDTQDIFAFSVSNESPINPNGISKKGGAIALTALHDITTGSLISYGGTESNNITVTTNGAFEAANSIISTSTNGAGKSGDIEIRVRSVALKDGTQVSTSTPTQGTGGNLTIIAPEFVRLSGSSPELVRYFYRYVVNKSQREVESILAELREYLLEPDRTEEVLALSKIVHDWSIPSKIESNLVNSQVNTQVNTLVFVLDGALRNIPMAALYDGQKYLVEKYAVALSLGLQLIAPKPLAKTQFNVLAAGLVQPPKEFSKFPPLPEIKSEFNLIAQAGVSTKQLIDKDFTSSALEKNIQRILGK